MNATTRSRLWAGWLAVVLSTSLSSFWAFWGSIENFHEGWYFPSVLRNVGLKLVQYLPWMLLPMAAAVLGLWRPVAGVVAHGVMAGAAIWLFGLRGVGGWLLGVPLLMLAMLWGYGRPAPVRWARWILVGLPVVTWFASGAYPAWVVFTRPSTVDLSMRRIDGNRVALVWAPAGPGWAESGVSWFEARKRCGLLAADGRALAGAAQAMWRTPTVDEAARTMRWRGTNAGGTWDSASRRAHYVRIPDKEAPLWNPHSPIIYWWTADETDANRAYRIAYNGQVVAMRKTARQGTLGFRCVKDASQAS